MTAEGKPALRAATTRELLEELYLRFEKREQFFACERVSYLHGSLSPEVLGERRVEVAE